MFSGFVAATIIKSQCFVYSLTSACVHPLPNDGTDALDVHQPAIMRSYVLKWPGVNQTVLVPWWWRPGGTLPRHRVPKAIIGKYGNDVYVDDPEDVVVVPLTNDRDYGNVDAFGTVSH